MDEYEDLVPVYDYLEALGFSDLQIVAIVTRAVLHTIVLDKASLAQFAADCGYALPANHTFNIGPGALRDRN